MNDLLKKYNDYLRLVGYVMEYELENNIVIKVPYREDGFLHLLGIHKLTDNQLIQFWLDRNNHSVKRETVIKKIIAEKFTDSDVRKSVNFHSIQERYERFSYNDLTSISYTDAIINFNAKIINSSLKADYLLFEEIPTGEYNHMAIAIDKKSNERFVESFFHEPSKNYLLGQTVVKIIKTTIRKPDGSVLISDIFEYNIGA